MFLLYINGGWANFRISQEKNTFWACFLGSELKFIFLWKVQLFMLFKLSFKFFAHKSLSWITEKRDVLSKNSLGFETKLSNESFTHVKESNGPRIEPWGAFASALTHIECWPYRTTLCFFPFRKFVKNFSKLNVTLRASVI